LQPDLNILLFPAWDCFPYEKNSPKNLISSARVRASYFLSRATKEKTIVLTTVNAILQKTTPKSVMQNMGINLTKGDQISPTKLSKILLTNGYSREDTANYIGDFALRGDILDFIIADQNQLDGFIGCRVNFFGDVIDNIKIFDPITQITNNTINQVEVIPVNEVIFSDENQKLFVKQYRKTFGLIENDELCENISQGRFANGAQHWLPLFYEDKVDSLMQYCHDGIFSIEHDCRLLLQERCDLIKEYHQARVQEKKLKKNPFGENIFQPLPIESLYFSLDQFWSQLNQCKQYLLDFNLFQSGKSQRIMDFNLTEIPDFAAKKESIFDSFRDFLCSNTHKKNIICYKTSYSKQRIERIFRDYEIPFQSLTNKDDNLKKGRVGLLRLNLESGFSNDELVFIADNKIFGEKAFKKPKKKISLSADDSLQIGELVVHSYYGIGKFCGIKNISTSKITNDFLEISFAGNDKLFVPVEDISLVKKYGEHNPFVKLDKLGVATWKNRQERVRKRIKVGAQELIKIAALRKMQKAPIFSVDSDLYQRFCDKFEFVETEDQQSAIEDVIADLQKGSPMDRLICGDVGFGKTEVALRAVFYAICNQDASFQVAVIVPTTLLCRQHFSKFQKRFSEFPVKVRQISRMITASQKKTIKQELASGHIDVIIGTHALLAKDIKFKNLGLIILDEEQHFGVSQKEKIKKFRQEESTHLLSLSATPIPRTLQMSLTGVKDLSVIVSPPVDRLPIRSFVTQYDQIIVRDAVMREVKRHGRIFFVVPKVKDITIIENDLKKILPEVKIASAHGQMSAENLDEIMNDFYDGKYEMLLSTTIIESGIDISIANTIIVYKAEMFGLSQLYQIRGRVGRGDVRAYAYLMHTANKKLTDNAKKRLKILQDIDSLGVGFNIASHDMDIRGSGNILGDEQSGHVKETGIELYNEMLNEEIANMSNQGDQSHISSYSTKLNLGVSLFIDENYIPEFSVRMSIYKRIADISCEEERDLMFAELEDRFGKPNKEIVNLLEIAYQKNLCQKCNVEMIEAKKDGIVVSFKNNFFANSEGLISLISSDPKIELNGHKILFRCELGKNILQSSLEILKKLSEL
jgi:transcription-repair coupling factor (superfamily II helicase)